MSYYNDAELPEAETLNETASHYLVTNFKIEQLKKYQRAIAEFERRHPEYKGLLYISDNPNDIIDMRGKTLDEYWKYRALMKKKPEHHGLSEFWRIYDKSGI